MRRLSAEIGRPVTFAMLQVDAAPQLWRELLDLRGRGARGRAGHPQVAGRPFGLLIGLQTTVHPFAAFRPSPRCSRCRSRSACAGCAAPEVRRAILAEDTPETSMLLRGLHRTFPMGDPPDYEPSHEDSIEAIAKRTDRDATELLYDRMLERDGRELLSCPCSTTPSSTPIRSARCCSTRARRSGSATAAPIAA